MRILFFTLHWGYLRNYDGVLRELASRGHELILVAEKEDKIGSFAMIEDLCRRYPKVRYEQAPDRKRDPWLYVGTWVRLGLDYLRYLRPEYQRFPKLWSRSRSRTPRPVVWLTDLPGMRAEHRLQRIESVLRTMEQLLPPPPDIEDFVAERDPDAVLVTPLLGLGTSQYDDLRVAKEMGIKTALCVGSWDHLSSKALIRFSPDLVTLWNETQKREAMEMHGIPEERIAVTGAQGWDRWFELEPSRSRERFCRDVGLDPERPFFLWLCSTPFPGSPPEAGLIERWVEYLRSSEHPRLRQAGILVRPHPQRMEEWDDFDLDRFENVTLWGDNPVTPGSREDYFDSVYYCAAAVGLNTSAMIEAGILGRPVHTILAPEFHDSQIETVHFHYLREVGGGLLYEADSVQDNAAQLRRVLDRDARIDPRSRAFTRAFVRPHGLEEPGTPRLVEAIEELLESDAPPAPVPREGTPLLRSMLRPVIGVLYVSVGMFRATPLGLRIHRGKKLVRAGLLRVGKLARRGWGRTQKTVRYALKDVRMALYRGGKAWGTATHRAQRAVRTLARRIQMAGHRAKKRVLAGQRLILSWIRPGDSSVD